MGGLRNSIILNKSWWLCLILIIVSCNKVENDEAEIICVECVEHQYSQIYNLESVQLTLTEGIYCIDDSAWTMTNNNYWTLLDQELLYEMIQSGYCVALESDTLNID